MRYPSELMMVMMTGALHASGCGDEASVGSDGERCYPGMRCKTVNLALDVEQLDDLARSADVERLMPTWTRQNLDDVDLLIRREPGDAVGQGALGGLGGMGWLGGELVPLAKLASGPGGIWLFAGEDGRLSVFQLDPRGEVLAESSVDAPAEEEEQILQQVCHAHGHEKGPILTLAWTTPCAEPSESDMRCTRTETLLFSDLPEKAPRRIPGEQRNGLPCSITNQAFRDASGDGVLLQSEHSSTIQMVDLEGGPIWEHTLSEQFVQGSYMVVGSSLSRSGALVSGLRPLSDDPVRFDYPAEFALLEVDADGVALSFVELAAGLSFGAPYALPRHDPQGRLILLATLENAPFPGDLMIVRHDAERGETRVAAVQRESYLELFPGPSSTDSEGNIYVATRAGPRAPEQQEALICRVTHDFEDVRCFAIDASPHAMQATEAGVVYTLSSVGLQRYDVPL